MRVSVLGVQYAVEYRTRAQDPELEAADCDGYCDTSSKKCLDDYMRKCMRHELVHAFLYESGLSINSLSPSGWASNEEMTDWMAIQGPKLYDAWKQAKCL